MTFFDWWGFLGLASRALVEDLAERVAWELSIVCTHRPDG